MHWHWQNLNDRKDGTCGLGVVNGRAWWHFGDTGKRPHGRTIGMQWVFHSALQLGAVVTRGGAYREHDFALVLHFAWFSLYLHTERVMPRWWRHDKEDAEYGLTFYGEDWRLSWKWGADPMSWSSRDPKWKNGTRSLKDVFFGPMQYREGFPETHRIAVPMPEGAYTGTCVMRDDSWKRPFWFRQIIRRAHIDMDKGQQVPVPGKGENGWDCGEDGIFGMTCPARDVQGAVAHVRASAMRDRERHGGRNWKPSTKPGVA